MNSKYIQYRLNKKYRKLIRFFVSRIYIDLQGDISKSVLLTGAARSGTTWLADVLASQIPARIMFEPFNPNLVPEYENLFYYQYMRPDASNPDLYTFAQKIFSGQIRNAWIDREVEHIFPRRRIIKAVRANLMLKWLDTQFPEVPKLFIARHPCAVVLSRLNLGWNADEDIKYLLEQPGLVEDFLSDKLDIISSVKTEEEKHAVIWCISNMVPIAQFKDSSLNCFYYENLVHNPEEELIRIFDLAKIPYDESLLNYAKRPSTTSTQKSAILTGRSLTEQWKDHLDKVQIRRIFSVVDRFGLNYPL